MPYLLRLDASSRGHGSHSRRLGDAVEARYRAARRGHDVRRRDLASDATPHISIKTIAGFWTAPADMTDEATAATATSDLLIDELMGADALLISTPMYNFGVPSALKAWIDQVVRVNRTFAHRDGAFHGLAPARTAYLALSYGSAGYAPGAPMAGMNHLEPYLTTILRFIGVPAFEVFRVEGAAGPEEAVEEAHHRALAAIDRAFAGSEALV